MTTIRDCVYGQAVGDALGVPYEFMQRGSFECVDMVGYGTHGQPAGTWSDDTSMALAICDSYRELRKIDAADIRCRFLAWLNNSDYTCDKLFDIGSATATALKLGHGLAEEYNNGNGSLMRTLPLAFTEATDDEVREVSAITHAHPMSTETCVKAVRAARSLLSGASTSMVAKDNGVDVRKPESEVATTGFVLHTFDAALYCLANTSSYEKCVLKAVNLGDDTDTTAAVAGAFAGIVYGFEGIPQRWTNALRGKDVIEAALFG